MAKRYDPIEQAYLNLTPEDIEELANAPNKLISPNPEYPGYTELGLMRQTDYLTWACKTLLNIDVIPQQAVILEELWIRNYPMYVATRGYGKLLNSETPIRVQNGWIPIKDIKIGDKVYGGDGKLCNVLNKTNLQKQVKFYKLTLRDGRTIRCCEDHQWKVWDKYKNQGISANPIYSVLSTKDMVNKHAIKRIGKKSNGTEFRYALPINKPLIEETEKELLIHPYIVGVLLGDGGMTTNATIITSADEELINRVIQLLPIGYKIKKRTDKYGYAIIRDKNIRDENGQFVIPFYQLLRKAGIAQTGSHLKSIPDNYKYSSYEQRLELIKGLNDTDGYSHESTIEYYTSSNKLSDDYLEVARSLGLHCRHSVKEAWIGNKRYLDCNRIRIYTDQPIFSLERKLQYLSHIRSKQGQSKFEKVFITKIEEDGFDDGYCIAVDSSDNTYITQDYIVTHNSFLLAVYCWLRLVLRPGSKIVVAGAAFRQSKIILDYMLSIYNNCSVLQSIGGKNDGYKNATDKVSFQFNGGFCSGIPIGTGDKIRGLRANIIIGEEFASHSLDIWETVIRGFTAVSQNPIQGVKEESRKAAMKRAGLWTDEMESLNKSSQRFNQSIVTGTADYAFMQFGLYWKKYKKIIESRGDKNKLAEIFPDGVDADFDWRDYSIIRIPYELVPRGFMDEKSVSQAKATIHSGNWNCEYGAVFSEDSDGFFKRTLIESCVVSETNKINGIWFNPCIVGNARKKYVIGIDPASETDNFAIVVCEIDGFHTKVVYCWTTNKKELKKRMQSGVERDQDFFGYVARKIRYLMKVFPPVYIGIDSQGGGIAVEEALYDPDKTPEGEPRIFREIDPEHEYWTDGMQGMHILKMINFADAKWVSEANHGMKKDLEDKFLLFPKLDQVLLAIEFENNKDADPTSVYDTVEDCSLEIEELKNELSTIVMTSTGNGPFARDRWDTPETKTASGKKGRLRKDRYSALLIANMLARQIARSLPARSFGLVGGAAKNMTASNVGGSMYQGDDRWTGVTEDCFIGISR